MLERYTLTSLEGVAEAFGGTVPDGCTPRFNLAPLQLAPIRTARAIVLARWGLLPPWRGHGGKRDAHVLHAPIEAIDRIPLLRNAFKTQRCLVIADGFFVWRRTSKKPLPVWIHPAPEGPHRRSRVIAFAGLAAAHRDDGQPSFAIVMGPASPLVASVVAPSGAPARAPDGAAMTPVVIPPDGHAAWLTGSREAALAQLGQMPAGWRADPVSTRVSSIDHDDEACVEPLGNPAQGELF
jgi:putative SOS response-associated peptidase YedK